MHHKRAILSLTNNANSLATGFSHLIKRANGIILTSVGRSVLGVKHRGLHGVNIVNGIRCIRTGTRTLPFPSGAFSYVAVSFNLHGIASGSGTLHSVCHILGPNNHLLILRFSGPVVRPLDGTCSTCSFRILPHVNSLITGSTSDCHCLTRSVHVRPSRSALGTVVRSTKFRDISCCGLATKIITLRHNCGF